MKIKKNLVMIVLWLFTPLALWAYSSEDNCKYVDQRILIAGASNETSCVPSMLCVASISCEDGFGKREKSIACQAQDGKCPSIKTCVADKKVKYFEEVKIGQAGSEAWKAYGISTAPFIISEMLKYQAEKDAQISQPDDKSSTGAR